MKGIPKKSKKRAKPRSRKFPKPTPAEQIMREKQYDLKNLGNIMTEFLNCFVVVGYDFDGNAVSISNYKNTQEYNSLSVLVQDYLIELQNRNNPEG